MTDHLGRLRGDAKAALRTGLDDNVDLCIGCRNIPDVCESAGVPRTVCLATVASGALIICMTAVSNGPRESD